MVLLITDSERRLAALRATTARLGWAGRVWFATLDRLRGIDRPDDPQPSHFAGRQGPFNSLGAILKERIRRDAGTSERQQIGIAIGRIAQELMANFFAVFEDWLGLKQSGEQGRTTDE